MSVRMVVDVQVKPGTQDELVRAYRELVETASLQPGFIQHQLCESLDDPERWIVISEWETLEASDSWDRSDEHRRLLAAMRAFFAQADRAGFQIRDGVDRDHSTP